jgi:release factor glutamine methyltransferase
LNTTPALRDLLHDAAERLAAAGVDSPRLDARLLLAHAMGVSRDDLIAAIRPPSAAEAQHYESLIARRLAREPLAYITGRKGFWSLDLKVGPGALVPRPETETLIELALGLFPDRATRLAIADLGAGTGALLAAALSEFPNAQGVAFERAPEALSYARANLAAFGSRATLIASDWAEAGDTGFDLIFSNPPYIPTGDIAGLAPEIRLFEPHAALDGGPDGLAAYRSLSELLPRLIRPGGVALVELGQGQAGAAKQVFQKLTVDHVAPDLAGILRVLVLKRPK